MKQLVKMGIVYKIYSNKIDWRAKFRQYFRKRLDGCEFD